MQPERRVPLAPVGLVNDRIVLRAFSEGDVPALTAAFADADIRAFNPGPEPDEGAAAVLTWLRHRNDWSAGTHASWAISAPRGELLGSVSLFDLSATQLSGEIGYWVEPGARGQGVATRAVDCVVDYAFTTLGLHRVYLHHAVDNTASCRVAAASGFRLEGTLLRSWRHGTDEFHDEHLHAQLAAERTRRS